eukprot:TRINITY_DN11254_c0_g2_i1.p1 TRINITY_DN11254_c0_g2~~TRINITY_DN11254_c0_g2_i1.p1  ORF type:complete len:467 (-),score=73.57 TRINITY_DN11254_c0_g2_i1:89-1489(-)
MADIQEAGSMKTKSAESSSNTGGSIFKVLIVSVGFMMDAYDLFVIGLVLVILNKLHPPPTKDELKLAETAITITALVGAAIGQLLFGFAGDRIGRRAMFVITLSTIIVFDICSALTFPIDGRLWICLSIFRFFLGVGIGGEYPLSATIAAEGATAENRGCRMASVFSMQGVGNFLAPCVVLFLLFVVPVRAGGTVDDLVWRLALGFGAIPCLMTAYWRFTLKESSQYQKAKAAMPPIRQILPIIWAYKWSLLGTASTWFLFDISFYGNGLFKETVLTILKLNKGKTQHELLVNTALFSLIISSIALPGYYLAIPVVDKWGRKPMQIFGFTMMGIIFLLMAIFLEELQKIGILFVILYGLTFFFSNFGPNTTTYIIPGEIFPTQVRAFCHGISAASGKLGAVVGVGGFAPLLNLFNDQPRNLFYICAGVSFLGMIITVLLIPEKKNQNLETHEINDEETINIKTNVQ